MLLKELLLALCVGSIFLLCTLPFTPIRLNIYEVTRLSPTEKTKQMNNEWHQIYQNMIILY